MNAPLNHDDELSSDASLPLRRNELEDLVAEREAKVKGVEKSELIRTTRGGKVDWKTPREVAAALKRREAFRSQLNYRRALRGGESSLIGDLEKRIEETKQLEAEWRALQNGDSSESYALHQSLRAIRERVETIKEELIAIETRIEERKYEHPFVHKAERVARLLANAQAKGDREALNQLQAQYAQDIKQYRHWRRSLQPDWDAAGACRLKLLQELLQVYRLRGDMTYRLANHFIFITKTSAPQKENTENNKKIVSHRKALLVLAAEWELRIGPQPIMSTDPAKSIKEQYALVEKQVESLQAFIKAMDRCLVSLREGTRDSYS